MHCLCRCHRLRHQNRLALSSFKIVPTCARCVCVSQMSSLDDFAVEWSDGGRRGVGWGWKGKGGDRGPKTERIIIVFNILQTSYHTCLQFTARPSSPLHSSIVDSHRHLSLVIFFYFFVFKSPSSHSTFESPCNCLGVCHGAVTMLYMTFLRRITSLLINQTSHLTPNPFLSRVGRNGQSYFPGVHLLQMVVSPISYFKEGLSLAYPF